MPLKSKSRSEIAAAIMEIRRTSGRCPRNLQIDIGKNFYHMYGNIIYQPLFYYITYSMIKASVIKRFNRMLKHAMWKIIRLRCSYKLIDALPRLIEEYKAHKHCTIFIRSVDVILEIDK